MRVITCDLCKYVFWRHWLVCNGVNREKKQTNNLRWKYLCKTYWSTYRSLGSYIRESFSPYMSNTSPTEKLNSKMYEPRSVSHWCFSHTWVWRKVVSNWLIVPTVCVVKCTSHGRNMKKVDNKSLSPARCLSRTNSSEAPYISSQTMGKEEVKNGIDCMVQLVKWGQHDENRSLNEHAIIFPKNSCRIYAVGNCGNRQRYYNAYDNFNFNKVPLVFSR